MSALPRPINQRGAVKGRWVQEQQRSRVTVFQRCRGVCEAKGCHAQATDWAHLFGRRHIVGEPHCSSPELTAGLCRTHHNAIDRSLDPELRDDLRWAAIHRFAQRYGLAPYGVDAVGVIRRLVSEVEARCHSHTLTAST